MAMSVVYTTVNGQILHENRGGVVSHFISDPLGSVVMVRDNSGNTVYEAEYDPYGNVQSETGTNPSEFGYVGTLGYVKDSAFSLYVRARYLLTNLGRWLTKDPLWPSEPGFVYAGAGPSQDSDPFGIEPRRGKPGRGERTYGTCAVSVCHYKTGPISGHKYVCVEGPNDGCAGGLQKNSQVEDHGSRCRDFVVNTGGRPKPDQIGKIGDEVVRCHRVSYGDCELASAVCACIRAARRDPPSYSLVGSNCYNFVYAMIDCGCATLFQQTGRRCSGIPYG